MQGIEPARIREIKAREEKRYREQNPKSLELHQKCSQVMPDGVPNYWLSYYPRPYPTFFKEARGAVVVDVDGNRRIDFCLGGTASLFGYSNPHIVQAVSHQMAHGASPFMATEDAYYVGLGMQRAFGLPSWQITISASEANRNAIRLSRMLTNREKILIFNGSYLGAVEDTFATTEGGKVVLAHGIRPNAVDLTHTTRVVEFNDTDALEKALADEKVACVLTEPAITNRGIIHPKEGFHQSLRDMTRKTGTLLVIDETQCIDAGVGGYSRAARLEPDMMTMGKPMAGGIPVGLLGMTQTLASRVAKEIFAPDSGVDAGMGSTLAGSALQLKAIRATLEHVMTERNYEIMLLRADALQDGMERALQAHGLPWTVTRLGARVELFGGPRPPVNITESMNAQDAAADFEDCRNLHALNRGIMLSPFGNTAVTCPVLSREHAQLHNQVFEEFLKELL